MRTTKYALLALSLLSSFAFGQTKKPASSENELKAISELKLNSNLTRLTVSPDGKTLYWLNKSDAKLQKVDLTAKDFILDKIEVDLEDGTEFLCFTIDGKWAFTCASPDGHFRDLEESKQKGRVQQIELATMKVTSTFSIKFDPYEICAPTVETVFLTPGSGQYSNLVAVDVKKKSIMGTVTVNSGKTHLRMLPNGDRLYFGSNNGSSSAVCGIAPAVATEKNVPHGNGAPGGGPFEISPDGKFAVLRNGFVARVSKSKDNDMKEAAKIKPHRASVIVPNANFMIVATPEGELVRYGYPDFEIIDTYNLPKPAYSLAVDPAGKKLYAALDNKKSDNMRYGLEQSFDDGVGNLVVFDISKFFEKK